MISRLARGREAPVGAEAHKQELCLRARQRRTQVAVEIARGVAGVRKVVRAFEVISEEELARTAPPKS